MDTTSLNESRVIKLSKAEPASKNNWKNYISECAKSVSSLTSERENVGGTPGGWINRVASNLIEGYLSPKEATGYFSFITGKGGSSLGVESLGEAFNVDPEVQLIASQDWRLNGIENEYKGVMESDNLVTKFLSMNKVGKSLSGFEDILNGVAMASAATGSNKSLYNYSTQTWWKNLKGWTGSDPVSVQFTFDFALGQYGLWNAKKEVVIPMLNLIAMFCPSLIADGSMIGPTATPTGMLYSVIAGTLMPVVDQLEGIISSKDTKVLKDLAKSAMSWTTDTYNSGANEGDNEVTSVVNGIASVLGGLTSEAVGLISNKLLMVLKDSTYNIQIGNFMSISNCICTGINSITFSNKVDENGYPISGSLNLVLRGVIPPTFSGTRQDLVTLRFGGF